MQTGFITGLLGGLERNRAEQQFQLTERKARGQEIDLVQREARRVADVDAQDEQQTMTQLMNPGLHPDSRNSIVAARNARRQQNQSYIQSLQGDPDKAADIKTRYGDLTQMLSPSAITTGNLPKPTMDLPTILSFLEKENKNIRGMGSEANKRAALARARGVAMDVYGASPDVVNRYLPEFGTETSRTPGKVSDWQSIEDIAGLPQQLQAGGKMQQAGGVTLETAMQDGKLMKRYQRPDLVTTETYEQPEKEALAIQKAKLDIPFLQARIDQVKAKTAAIPQEVDLKYKGLMAKIADQKVKNSLRQLAIGVSQEANNIRMWGLQRTHERGMMGLSLRAQGVDMRQDEFSYRQRKDYIDRLDKLGKSLDGHIGKAAMATQKGMPQVTKAEVDMAKALKQQIEAAKMYLNNSDNPDYNEAFINSELDEGGFVQRPSRMMGMGGMPGLVNPGDVSYNMGGYGGLSPEAALSYLGRGLGYNANAQSPLYSGGVFAGNVPIQGAGGALVGNPAVPVTPQAGTTRTVTVPPIGANLIGANNAKKKIEGSLKGAEPLYAHAARKDKETKK